MEIKIRSTTKKDLGPLAKVYSLVYKESEVKENWDILSAKKLLTYWFERQPDLFFVAEKNSNIIGAVVAGIKPWWDGNHLVDGEIFVHPKYQKEGAGTELSKVLYKKALEEYGVVYFDTYTFKNTKFPLDWYKSQGFKENTEWTMIEGKVKDLLFNLKK
jgi:ribosomal protein S18 acetylase RimI-like enzyme